MNFRALPVLSILIAMSALPPFGRLAAVELFDGRGGSLVIKDYLLLESPRVERSHLDLSSATPGVQNYSGGYLPSNMQVSPKMYTFKAAFRVDPSLKDLDLSLYMGLAEYPLRLYLNGVEILSKGRYIEGHYNSSLRTVDSIYLSPDLLHFGAQENSLVLEAYPLYENWGLDRIYIDRRSVVDAAVFLRNFVGVNVIQGAFVLACIIGLYFVALVFFERQKYGKYIVFSLICASFCLAYLNVTVHNDANNEAQLEALSKGGLVLMSSFLLVFCCEFTSVLNKKRIFPLASLSLGVAAAILVMTRQSKETILALFGWVMNCLIVPQLIASIAILVYAFVKNKNRSVMPLLFSFVIVIATAAHDVVFLDKAILPYAWVTAYGYLAMVVAIFILLAKDQGRLLYLKEPKVKLSLDAKGLAEAERLYISSVIAGKSVKEVAFEFAVSESTVRNTLSRAYKKLGVTSKSGLATLAEKYEIVK
jgi:DNA-binding CsgD family transcriptional regulator